MTKNIQKCLLSIIIITNLFSCASSQTQATENRQIAQASEDQLLEAEFQNILASPQAAELTVAKMDKLFTLLLKANSFVDKFSQDLDRNLAFKKKNPKQAVPEIADSAAYKSLLKAWNLKERYSHEIEFLYSRALDIRTDLTTSEDLKIKTRSVLKAVTTYAKTSQNLKRIELQSLLVNLSAIYKKNVASYKQVIQEQGNIKDVSSISDVAEYNNLVFSNPSDLIQYAKNIPTQEKTAALLAQPRYQKISAAVDADLNEIADPISVRSPQSLTQDLTCKDGKKICASVGEPGNIVGKVFPIGIWAFTYDDGPTPALTSKIMDHFINYKDSLNPTGKATFFWTANHFDPQAVNEASLIANQAMIKKAVAHGFGIANHSYDHQDLNKSSTDRTKQILFSNKLLESAIRKEDPSYKVQYFRCPYGSCYAPKIPAVRQMFVDQKQVHVYWRIDSLDWKFKDSAKASSLIIKQMELYDRGIILMHDVQDTTPETTRIVLDWMKKQNDHNGKNYKMATVAEAVELTNAQ